LSPATGALSLHSLPVRHPAWSGSAGPAPAPHRPDNHPQFPVIMALFADRLLPAGSSSRFVKRL